MLESRHETAEAKTQARSPRSYGDLATSFADNAESVVSTARGVQEAHQELTDILSAIDSLWEHEGPSARNSTQRKCISRLQQQAAVL